ncbi:MAG: NmrA/HSCARG family protein [Labilithrix sp.]|nr:NmrA/HSCARG family protein [Labilithrix sp.]
MGTERVIAIVGATGAQGGGLARAILADRSSAFRVRAVTRKPGSKNAKALADAGAEIVVADADDAASLERAFAGAYGAFCVTNFWEHFSPERELEQAANMARAAKAVRLAHVIWSTLEDSRQLVPLDDTRVPTLMARYKVPHTDAKGEADRLFHDAGIQTTRLLTSFYWENFLSFAPRRDGEGRLVLALPLEDKRLAGIATEDIGRCALGIFERELVGESIGVAGAHLSGHEMAAGLSHALGEQVHYEPLPVAAFRAVMRTPENDALEHQTGFSAADDTANMFQLLVEHERFFLSSRDVARSRALNPQLESFDAWLERHAVRLRERT